LFSSFSFCGYDVIFTTDWEWFVPISGDLDGWHCFTHIISLIFHDYYYDNYDSWYYITINFPLIFLWYCFTQKPMRHRSTADPGDAIGPTQQPGDRGGVNWGYP
jgi:hypothetical protein